MRTSLVWLIVLVLVPVLGAGATHAEESGLVTRLFDVTALTMPRPDFLREHEPVGPDYYGDEENPLFGGESEEGYYPLGMIDELIELVRMHVESESWGSTLGASLMGIGERILVVRTFEDIADKVAAYLAVLERQIMRSVTIDIQAVRLDTDQVRAALRPGSDILVDPGKLGGILTEDNMGPGAAMLTFERSRSAVFAGMQRAYVGDFDVEVAQDAKVSDPIVYVDNLGLSADVRPILSPDGSTCLLDMRIWLALLADSRTLATGDERVVEAPEYRIARAVTTVELPAGAWALVDGESNESKDADWMFLVRAVPVPMAGSARVAPGVVLEAPASRPSRRFELRSFDVGILGSAVESQRADNMFLVPSNFTPPEPPELEDPMPIFAADTVVDLIRHSIAPASWDLKGASIEARSGWLYVQNSADVLDVIGKALTVMHQEFLVTVVTTAELVEVPESLASEIEANAGRALTQQAAERLAAALGTGDATRKGTVRVTNMAGARNAVSNGRRIAYLSDFEVEIAQGAAISNPVVQTCISGTQFDIRAARTPGAGSVQMVIRFMKSEVGTPIPVSPTPHGDVEVPVADVFRVRSALTVPIGQTVVAASVSEGRTRNLLLVTPRVSAPRR